MAKEMKRRLYEIKPVGKIYGVYSRDFGSDGGNHLIKTFYTEEEAKQYVTKIIVEGK